MTSLRARQRAPVPFPTLRREGIRRGNSLGGAVAALPRRTVGAQREQLDTDTRYLGDLNDGRIRRDHTPWYPSEQRTGVGTAEVDWTAAGPYRPELNMRTVNYRRMAGTDQTRALADPRDPNQGLHTNPKVKPSGNLTRFQAGAPAMRPVRTDRLSPARYHGQSYSQTTVLQGGGRRR